MKKHREENDEIIRLNGGKEDFRKRYKGTKGLVVYVDRIFKQMDNDDAIVESKKNENINKAAKKHKMSVSKFKRLKRGGK